MTQHEKIDFAVSDLEKRGVKRNTIAPPLYRLLWKLGVPIAPPVFNPFVINFLVWGGYFAAFMGVTMGSYEHWRGEDTSHVPVTALLSGMLFGLWMATVYFAEARKLSLPKWKDFTNDAFPKA